MGLEVVPATAARWDAVASVMGERGDPSRCWCQYFRLRGKAWESATVAERRDALRDQLDTDPPPGVLAYDDGTPVGWCAVAPRTAYPRVMASPNWRWDAPEGVWSVTCFVVPPGRRRQGLSQLLLSGAVDLAATYGASVVEGCAVDTARIGKTTAANLYRGPLSTFLAAGFTVLRDAAPAWVLVRKDLA